MCPLRRDANVTIGPLANADELGPDASEDGTDEHIMRVVAERVAILTHGHAKIADLVFAGGVEKRRQDGKRCGYKIHCTLREGIDPSCIRNMRGRAGLTAGSVNSGARP